MQEEGEKIKVLHALKAFRDSTQIQTVEANLQGIDKEISDVVNEIIWQRNAHKGHKEENRPESGLREICDSIKSIANGDLSQRVEIRAQGEMAELKDAVNNLIDMLNAYSIETNKVMHEICEGNFGRQVEFEAHGNWQENIANLNLASKSLHERVQNTISNKMDINSTFMANITYDLRTPLNGILGISELILTDSPLVEEVQEYVTMIRQSGLAMIAVLNDLIDHLRLIRAVETVEDFPFTLQSVIKNTVGTFSRQFARLIVNVEIKKGVPENLRGDADKIQRLIRQVLSRTIGHEGEILITIAHQPLAHGRIMLIITLYAKERYFTHLEQDTQFHFCRLLIELMQGKLRFQDTPNGSVTFEIPVQIDKEVRGVPDSYQLIPGGADDVTPRVILVVSPHESTRNVLARMVVNLGLTPVVARSADEAEENLISAGNRGFLIALVDESCAHNKLSKLVQENNVKELLMCSDVNRRSESFLVKPVLPYDLVAAVQHCFQSKLQVLQNSNYWTSANSHFKILLVEDNIINQKVIEKMLKNNLRFSGSLVIAANGQEAVHQFQQEKYDLILMDAQMPVKDGYEATKDIRGLEQPEKRTPIIGMTANSSPDHLHLCHAAGMDECISKPVAVDILRAIVAKYLT